MANFAVQQDGRGKLIPLRHLVDGKSQQWLKDKRLGNTYHSQALPAPKGITKKVNALLRRSFNLGEATGVARKRFFLSARALVRSPERAEEAFLLVNKRDNWGLSEEGTNGVLLNSYLFSKKTPLPLGKRFDARL